MKAGSWQPKETPRAPTQLLSASSVEAELQNWLPVPVPIQLPVPREQR
jgi:hypothetical protein